MIFSNVNQVQERGFELDPAAVERVGVFDGSVCWGVWVPDPRGEEDRRKHLLVSPIHPSVWPYLLRLEIKLRDKPGTMATATKFLVDSQINIQFAECAISGHHHATWNVVAEANDVRRKLHQEFTKIQELPDDSRTYLNRHLVRFSNRLAARMLAKAVNLPPDMEKAHRKEPSYIRGELDCGFLHNRIVDKKHIPFFYKPSAMPTPELVDVAKKGLPRAVTCRWMQSLAFFAIYGDMRQHLRLQYDKSTRLLKLADDSQGGLGRILEQHDHPTALPARAVTSFDTAGLYFRIDIIEPTEARSRFFKSTIDYTIDFASDALPGRDDTARGLWLSLCEQVAGQGGDLVKIANRTTHRDHRSEAGAFTLIGRMDTPISDGIVEQLSGALQHRCEPEAKNSRWKVTPKTAPFHRYKLFVSRRSTMPKFDEIDHELNELARSWGFKVEFVKDEISKPFDAVIEQKLLDSDCLLQIVTYSADELKAAGSESMALPDFQWLIHEYGLAIGAGIPHARVFDVTHRKLQEWQHTFSPRGGEAAGWYNTNAGIPAVRRELEKVFSVLANEMRARAR